MLFWTWNTQEMLDIVEWMKTYNSSHAKKIVFTGIDMQGIAGPLTEIKTAYNKYHTDSSATLPMLEAKLNYVKEARRNKKYSVGYKAAKNNKHKFRKLLNEQKEWANNKISNPHEREWVLQNIRLLQQYTEMVTPAVRDQYMAENLLWIKKQFPQQKIIVWAHNGHIQKIYPTRKVMGQYLADELKTDYYTLGFAFHEGDYTAMGKNGLSSYVAQKATAGTFEYYFHLTGIPLCMIDLNKIPTDKPEAKWLTEKLKFRWTGAVPMDNELSETSLVNNFDALIYIDKITSSQLLSPPAKK
jgi:erythromycin esterase